MIPALLEGLAQSLLPCSWVVLVPAVAVAMSSSRPGVLGLFAASVVLFVWGAVAGWLVVPVWVAGVALALGAVIWWRRGLGLVATVSIGAGAAWAWAPCVGVELGRALNIAQQDALAALPGLGAFMLGVVLLGLLIGQGARVILRRRLRDGVGRLGAVVVGVAGVSMIVGLYSSVSSTLARWSAIWWA